MQQHSKLYSEIFPESLMMDAFGTTTPSQSKKNEYFFNCWMSWRDNEFKTSALFVPAITPAGFKTLVKYKIMHRDFKLANLMRHDNIIKIVDFGFSKILENDSKTDTMLGSPLNMAPEILNGE